MSDPEQESDLDTEIGRIDGNVNALGRRIERLGQEMEELRQRVEQLEHVNNRLVTDLPTNKQSKSEKLVAICCRASEDAPNGAYRGSISRDLAAGAADCGKRHALNLFDDLAAIFDGVSKNTTKAEADQTHLDIVFGEDGPAGFLEQVHKEFPEVDP